MEKRIQILVGFSARRNIGDFCHPRGSLLNGGPQVHPRSQYQSDSAQIILAEPMIQPPIIVCGICTAPLYGLCASAPKDYPQAEP